MEHVYTHFPQGTLVKKEHLQHSISVYVPGPIPYGNKWLWAQGTGLCFLGDNTHLFSFRIESGRVPSAHTLPHLPSLFALSLLGIGNVDLLCSLPPGFQTQWTPLSFQPPPPKKNMPQTKEGRGGRKEVRAVLITKPGGFATFLGERVEPRKMAYSVQPGLGVA